jgi:hypothetical protein
VDDIDELLFQEVAQAHIAGWLLKKYNAMEREFVPRGLRSVAAYFEAVTMCQNLMILARPLHLATSHPDVRRSAPE